MKKSFWEQKGKTYSATILDNVAIVKEIREKFTAFLVNQFGTVIQKSPEEYEDFTIAENWALFFAVNFEYSKDREAADRKIIQAIDECSAFLTGKTNLSHIKRLGQIRNRILRLRAEENGAMQSSADKHFPELIWNEIDKKTFFAATEYGRAVIFEVDYTAHKTWIEHESGIKYKSFSTFVDFLDAEYWVKGILNQLNNPQIDDANSDSTRFTLKVCRQLFGPHTDPLTMARLNFIDTLFDEGVI